MAKRIEDRAAFNLVRYANCWEDAEVLCKALQPSAGKRYLSIASAGDNSFSLLSRGAQVIAVDLSPSQLACVELRKVSFARLEYQDLLRFFGVHEYDSRAEIYQTLRQKLSSAATEFWDNNPDSIRTGFIHNGKFESYFRTFRTRMLPLVHRRKKIYRLLEPKSREQRIEFFNKRWNTLRWRMLFRIFFSRFVMGRLGRDPEFFRYVEGSVSDRILDRTKHAITELETHSNPYLTYILTGNYGDSLPHYLQPGQFDAIRNNLENLKLAQMPIEQAAEKYGGDGFDGFNLSDIFEYLDPKLCEDVYLSLLNKSRPGARFAYWNMLVPRRCPKSLAHRIVSHDEHAHELLLRDKAWFYSAFVLEEFRE